MGKRQNGDKWYNNELVKIIIGFLIGTILLVGIPLLINEIYKYGEKHGPLYITLWEAKDALIFYGSILAAIVTAVSLFATIVFTRKQIARERFLECNRNKWEKVDSIITQVLIDISPLNMCNKEKLDGPITSNLQTIILNLQNYSFRAKTSLNMVKCYVGPLDYERIGEFITAIQNSIEKFCEIDIDLINEYMDLQIIAQKNNGFVPEDELLAHLDRTTEINKRIPPAHDGVYQALLNMKREVFERINAEIDEQADEILLFKWRK